MAFAGDDVSSAGDVTGDGYADILLAASRAAPTIAPNPACLCEFRGRPDAYDTDVLLDTIDGSRNRSVIQGDVAGDNLGVHVNDIGDFETGDGLDDLAVAANRNDGSGNVSIYGL